MQSLQSLNNHHWTPALPSDKTLPQENLELSRDLLIKNVIAAQRKEHPQVSIPSKSATVESKISISLEAVKQAPQAKTKRSILNKIIKFITKIFDKIKNHIEVNQLTIQLARIKPYLTADSYKNTFQKVKYLYTLKENELKESITELRNNFNIIEKQGPALKKENKRFNLLGDETPTGRPRSIGRGKSKEVLESEQPGKALIIPTSDARIGEIQKELSRMFAIRDRLLKSSFDQFKNIEIFDEEETDQLLAFWKDHDHQREITAADLKAYGFDDELTQKVLKLIHTEENKLFVEQLKNKGSNLALNIKEVRKEERVEHQYTLITDKAKTDLEKEIMRDIPFATRLKFGFEYLNGMNDLHATGHVHGDSKPDNCLIYEENGKAKLSISDFGKTQPIRDDQKFLYTGNIRFAPPERQLSKQGEVYSAALILIRVLEEPYLKKMTHENQGKRGPMLLMPAQQVKTPSKGRRGIEEFLVSNALTPQREVFGNMDRFNFAMEPSTRQQYQAAQDEVYAYIEALMGALSQNIPMEKLQKLEDLLKDMTSSLPSHRPTMQEALSRYSTFMAEL